MIIYLRDKGIAQFVMGAIAIIFIIGSVFLYGYSKNSPGNPTGDKIVLKISNRKIPLGDYEKMVSGALRQRGRNANREQIETQVLDQLVMREVILANSDVTDVELNEYIRNDAKMLELHNLYQRAGIGSLYREDLRVQVGGESLRNRIQNLELISDREVEDEYYQRNHKVKVKFIKFQNSDYEKTIEVSDEEAQKYLDEHQEDFREDIRVNLKFIKIDPAEFVSEDDQKKYYEKHKKDYAEVDKVNARHILRKVSEGATDAEKAEIRIEAEELLATVRKEIENGGDFAELARKHSEGPSAPNGGALGWFERGKMVKPFETAAFDQLEVGEISDLVETQFGFHIIKVEEKKSESKSFDEVKSEIENKLIKIEGVGKAQEIAENLLFDVEMLDYEPSLKEENYVDLSLEVKETGLFDRSVSSVPEIGSKWQYGGVIDQVFNVNVGVNEMFIAKKSNGDISAYLVGKIIEKRASEIPPLEAVKEKVIDKIKEEKSRQLAIDDAKSLMEKLGENETIDDLSKKYKSPKELSLKRGVKESGSFALSETSSYIPSMGQSRKAIFAAFKMKKGEVRGVFEEKDACYIIQLSEVEKPKSDDEAEMTQLHRSLLQSQKSEAYNNWYASVKSEVKIVDNRSK